MMTTRKIRTVGVALLLVFFPLALVLFAGQARGGIVNGDFSSTTLTNGNANITNLDDGWHVRGDAGVEWDVTPPGVLENLSTTANRRAGQFFSANDLTGTGWWFEFDLGGTADADQVRIWAGTLAATPSGTALALNNNNPPSNNIVVGNWELIVNGTNFDGVGHKSFAISQDLSSYDVMSLKFRTSAQGTTFDNFEFVPQTSNAIGVTFNGDNPNYTTLAPTDIAGVVPAANWNNLDTRGGALGFSFGPQPLVDNTGAATTVTVSSTLSGGWNDNAGIGNSTPDHALMNGVLLYDNAHVDSGSINVSGLNGFADLYDVYVYIEGGSSDNRDIEATVAGITIRGQDRGGFDGVFTPADGTLDGTTDHDYILFSGLTGDGFSIELVNPLYQSGVSGRPGIAGFQIVAREQVIPEPLTMALWALGLPGLAWYGRRRRK